MTSNLWRIYTFKSLNMCTDMEEYNLRIAPLVILTLYYINFYIVVYYINFIL